MLNNPTLTRAVHLALVSSASAAAALYATDAISQETELSEIIVTGSRIRRVEAETASPVFTMNRGMIEATGITTMGELVQQVPSISGAATNTTLNNGGGDGASTIELRGLGDERTLVLLNGRRMTGIAGGGAVDVNIFPVNLIERVDVLKEGAGAVYGSDAIGGVVNFITRKDFDGMELSADYGNSSESDGQRQALGLAWGTASDRGDVVIGANYNKQDEISAGDRKFSREALYLYGVYGVIVGGSSRTPNGRIRFPTGSALATSFGCSSVTKLPGAPGTSLADYRCFAGGDLYNYQPLNLIMTPQERMSLFTSANYNVTEDVEVYTELLHAYTTSGFAIAELPFDARSDNIIIPANNYYNPFGIDFGGIAAVNPNAQWRMQSLGKRQNTVNTTTDHGVLGARGKIMDSGWDWDLSAAYDRIGQDVNTTGYLLNSKLQPAFGPSFLDPLSGEVVCGTPGNIIAGCVPVNIFNINDPSQTAALATIAADYNQVTTNTVQSAALDFTGEIFSMPAGKAQMAVGGGYEKFNYEFDTDALSTAQAPDFLTCGLAQDTCTVDTRGTYNVSSLYVEALFPLLKEMPGAEALNLIVGSRYSDYSTFGDTVNSSVKLEWRPIGDLLVRGSYSEVFRAPQISDLFAGTQSNAPNFNDPCVGLTAAQVVANPNLALACENVPTDGTFTQDNSQVTGLLSGNVDLQPETGEVLTAGLVYQPSFLNGFSTTVDYWNYRITDIITGVDVNTTASVCVATGDPVFCGLINRAADGAVLVIGQPTLNFGKLETSGWDIGFKYALNDTAAGSFQFSLDTTYIDAYDSTPCSTCGTQGIAGTWDRQYGNYARWRGFASVGWSRGPFTGLLAARYVGDLQLSDPDGAPGKQPALQVPSRTYLDLSFGYTFREKLSFQIGANNVTDEQPPIMYQNNVINANTDVSTYDTVGTYYRASVKYKF